MKGFPNSGKKSWKLFLGTYTMKLKPSTISRMAHSKRHKLVGAPEPVGGYNVPASKTGTLGEPITGFSSHLKQAMLAELNLETE
jgi:hypothetical protein